MKNIRALWMLGISVVLGMAVVAMATTWLVPQSLPAQKVIVSAVDIELGTRLNQQMLTVIDWPQASVPEGTFTDLKDLQDRVLKTSVQRGEVILASKLAPIGAAGGLSAVITDGKRAMTVRVNDVVGVAGFALPGNYVDVLVHMQLDDTRGDEGKSITKTVLEHVLVLAVAQEAGRDDTKPRVVNAVTLELTPAEAERIDLARNVGTLSLALRNQIDHAPVITTGITKSQLFDDAVALAASAPVPVPDKPVVKKAVVRVRARPAAAPPVPGRCVEFIQDGTSKVNCF